MKHSSFLVLLTLVFVACSASHAELSRSEQIRADLLNPDCKRVLVASHRADWRNWPENSIPAIESAHAIAALKKMTFKPSDVVVLTVSGRGDKDVETYLKNKEMAKEYGDF